MQFLAMYFFLGVDKMCLFFSETIQPPKVACKMEAYSRNMYTFCTFGAVKLSRCFFKKISPPELSRKFIKGPLLVGNSPTSQHLRPHQECLPGRAAD